MADALLQVLHVQLVGVARDSRLDDLELQALVLGVVLHLGQGVVLVLGRLGVGPLFLFELGDAGV